MMINRTISEKIYITDELSIINSRHIVSKYSKKLGFGTLAHTKIIIATSELTRNIEKYAGKGVVYVEIVEAKNKKGISLTFEDWGPGISDIEDAMRDGYSTSGGLGLGLPGTKRLMDEFEIFSKVGQGTTVKIVKWAD